jgi:hypothetical protein
MKKGKKWKMSDKKPKDDWKRKWVKS